MVKTHDKEYFHKYVSGETALRILETLKLKWSAARLFNDPFDVQMELRFDFDRAALKRRLLEAMERIVFSAEEPQGNEANDNFRHFKQLWMDKENLDRPRLRKIAMEVMNLDGKKEQTIRDEYRQAFRDFLSEFKILSVAENHDHLLMWAHYADRHQGAVLRLRCLPASDTALCAAMPVLYSEELPVMADLDDWVRRITGQPNQVTGEAIFKRYILTKSEHWNYEREWRVFTKRDREDGDGYVLLGLLPEEIDAVYLGCKIPEETTIEIAKRLTGPLGHVDLYQARKSPTRFALEFDLMGPGIRS